MLRLLLQEVALWVGSTYGRTSLMDRQNRAARVFEEACELLQAEGGNATLAEAIVKRCYSRPVGEPSQEAAGTLFTLLAWSAATGIDLENVTKAEIERVKAKDPSYFRMKHREKFAAGTDLIEPLLEDVPFTDEQAAALVRGDVAGEGGTG